MKIILFLLLLTAPASLAFGQSSVYQIKFPGLASGPIAMKDFSGKKVIVAVCSAAHPDLKRLQLLDSLYTINKGRIILIVIPVRDFDASAGEPNLKTLLVDSLHLDFPVAAVSYGKRSNAAAQQPLLQWLTAASANNHFDYDLSSPDQLFAIGENGNLFAIMMKPDHLVRDFNSIVAAKALAN